MNYDRIMVKCFMMKDVPSSSSLHNLFGVGELRVVVAVCGCQCWTLCATMKFEDRRESSRRRKLVSSASCWGYAECGALKTERQIVRCEVPSQPRLQHYWRICRSIWLWQYACMMYVRQQKRWIWWQLRVSSPHGRLYGMHAIIFSRVITDWSNRLYS